MGKERLTKEEIPHGQDSRSVASPEAHRLRENLVHLIPHMLASRRLQVPHRALHVGVTKPLLNSPQIDAGPQRPRRKRCAELVQPEVLFIQLRPLGHSFQAIEKIELRLAPSRREDQIAALV